MVIEITDSCSPEKSPPLKDRKRKKGSPDRSRRSASRRRSRSRERRKKHKKSGRTSSSSKRRKSEVKKEKVEKKEEEEERFNAKTSKVVREAVEDAMAVLAVMNHKLVKQPNIDEDVEKLMHKFLEEHPDEMPQESSCSFGSFEDMAGPHGYSCEELDKMLRRWHRSGFLTGYYRAVSRRKLQESGKATSSKTK